MGEPQIKWDDEIPDTVTAWAAAIQQHEGWHPGTRAWRNNNPGNIKGSGDAGQDKDGFARFSSPELGMEALKSDLQKKIERYPDHTVLQTMTRYLGGDPNDPKVTDQGDPFEYANTVSNAMGVTPGTPLKALTPAPAQAAAPAPVKTLGPIPEDIKWDDEIDPSTVKWDEPPKSIVQKGLEAFNESRYGRRFNELAMGSLGGAIHLIRSLGRDAGALGIPQSFSGKNIMEIISHPTEDNPLLDDLASAMAVAATPFIPVMALYGAAAEGNVEQIATGFGAKAETAAKLGRFAGDLAEMFGPLMGHMAVEGTVAAQEKIGNAAKLMSEAAKMLKDESLTQAAGEGLSTFQTKGRAPILTETPAGSVVNNMYGEPIGPRPVYSMGNPYSVEPSQISRDVGNVPQLLTQTLYRQAFQDRMAKAGPLDAVAPPPPPPEEGYPNLYDPYGQSTKRAELDARLREIIDRARARGVEVPETANKILQPTVVKPKPMEVDTAEGPKIVTPVTKPLERTIITADESLRQPPKELVKPKAVQVQPEPEPEPITKVEPPRPIEDSDMKGTMLMAFKLKDGRVVYDATKSPSHGISAERMGVDPETVASTGFLNDQGRYLNFEDKTAEVAPISPRVPTDAARPVVAGIAPEKQETLAQWKARIEREANEGFTIPGLRTTSVVPGELINRNLDNKLALLNKVPGNGGLNQLMKEAPDVATLARAAGVSRELADTSLRLTSAAIEKIGNKYGVPKAWEKFDLAMTESRLRGGKTGYQKMARMLETASDSDVLDLYGNDPWGVSDRLKTVAASQKFLERNLVEKADRRYEKGDAGALRDLLVKTFDEAAKNVGRTSLTEAQYREITSSPWFAEAHQLATEHLIGPYEENHARNGGVPNQFPGEYGYWPLISKSEPTLARKTKGGIPLPQNETASYLAKDYDMSIKAKYGITRYAYEANNKAILMKALKEKGLLVKDTGVPITSFDYNGKTYTAERLGSFAQDSIVPGWLHDEIGTMFEKRPPGLMEKVYDPETDTWKMRQKSSLGKVLTLSTQGALLGPAEGVGHTFNVVGNLISRIPDVGESVPGKALSLPILKTPTLLIKAIMQPTTGPEIMAIAREMVANGDAHPRMLSEASAWTKSGREFARVTGAELRYGFGPMLYGPSGLDFKARLLARRLALMSEPDMTPGKMHQFMNNFGQYNRALTDQTTRAIKGPFAPFFTASSTAVRTAIHTLTGQGVLPGGVGLRLLNMVNSGALAVTAAWIGAHKAYRDEYPWEDRGSKLFQIRLKPEDRASPIVTAIFGPPGNGDVYLNFGRLMNPMVERMGRVLGIRGAAETLQRGGTQGQAIEGAYKDVVNTVLQMISGPPVRFGLGFFLGIQPRLTSVRDAGKSTSVFAPVTQVKTEPGIPAIAQRLKDSVIAATPVTAKAEEALGKGTVWKSLLDTFGPSILNGPIKWQGQTRALARQLKESRSKGGH